MTSSVSLDQYYSTSDLALATALSLHLPIDLIDRLDSQRVIFCFLRSKELDEFIESYWRGDLLVKPQDYFNQLRVLKSRIYQKG